MPLDTPDESDQRFLRDMRKQYIEDPTQSIFEEATPSEKFAYILIFFVSTSLLVALIIIVNIFLWPI